MKQNCATVRSVCCSLFLSLAVLSLCTSATLQSRPVSAASPAFIRVLHASPGIATADVFLDGTKLLSNFAFGTVTNYAAVPPGPHKVQVALIGRGIGAATITQTLNVSPGVAYTVAAIGTQATGFSLQTFIDNNQLTPGSSKLRFYHLSPGTGTVTVSNGSSTLIQGLAYRQASSYVDLQPNAYTFQANVTRPSSSMSIPLTLKANMVTSVFAVGILNGSPRIQFVSAQVAGIPGMPQTGSDPHAVIAPAHANMPPSPLPLLGALALFLLAGFALAFWRFARHR
jgi:hypothetical protein